MNSPEADTCVWNIVQELVSLEKDIYRVKVSNNKEANNRDIEAWRAEYREHLRSKSAKRQQLLESLEKGLKSCGWNTLRQIRAGTSDSGVHGNKVERTGNNNTSRQKTEEPQENQLQKAKSPLNELDSVACKLDFETEQGTDNLEEPSNSFPAQDKDQVENVQREYIQLKTQYRNVLVEKEALEQHCSNLENLIQIQKRYMEYYEEELAKMTKNFGSMPLKEKTNTMHESNKENLNDNNYGKWNGRDASQQLEDITASIQQQIQRKYGLEEEIDCLQQRKEDIERTVESLQDTKEQLQDKIGKLDNCVHNLEKKKQIALDTLYTMFEQIHSEVSRCAKKKYQVTHLATGIVNSMPDEDGNCTIIPQTESTRNTSDITIKAISKLQDKVYTLQDALAQSREETNRYKKALYALREEHEMTIQKYSKEFQILVQELQLGQRKCKKYQRNRPVLSCLR